MPCAITQPTYVPPYKRGLKVINSEGDGYSMNVLWYKAYASVNGYSIAYNIYYSSEPDAEVFNEGPKYMSTNTSGLRALLTDFSPGEVYYFAVRAMQYNPNWFDPADLPGDGYLRIYPEALLTSDITETDTIIPITDIGLFPNYGVIQVGAEWIRYTNREVSNNRLTGATRGFLGTIARSHTTDGYDGYVQRDPTLRFFTGLEDNNEFINQEQSSFQNYNIYTLTDGYKERDSTGILTTDLSASDDDRVDFRSYDYAGWHRTDPRLLFQGKCLDTYIGGEHFCADGYEGVGRTVRNIPISEQADRREEMLLENTGQSVVLVQRLWDGIVCSCYEPNRENPDSRCPFCFPAGTLVRTENGYLPIEQIKVGDSVLTDDGSFQKVVKTFERDFDGELVGVTPTVSANTIWSTPEHPYLVMRGIHKVQGGCGPKCNMYINNFGYQARGMDIRQLPSGKWHARIQVNKTRKVLGSFNTRNMAIKAIRKFREENPYHALKWDAASSLKKKDWVVAKWPVKIVDVDTITIPKEFGHNPLRNGVDIFKVDEEFLWVIGLYLAEGSCSKRTISFALHREEEHTFARKVSLLFSKYGYNNTVRKSSENGICIEVYSTSLAEWFPKWLGQGCQNKHIPEEFMYLPANKQKALFQGIYDGDGSKRDHEIGQTSPNLALQMCEILHRIGEQPIIRRFQHRTLTPAGKKRKLAYVNSWAEDITRNGNRKGRWVFENEILTQIRNVEHKKYIGKVYNLEVEKQNTYVVQGVVVHNCMGTGFIGGYQQYFNPRRSDGRILVRFGPYNEDLKPEEGGLESYVIHDCWTLTVPTLRDRDFIIKFAIDGTEEFRYEVLDVTRNSLFYGESGKQNFKAQRVRKTDPIYQWRAIRSTAMFPSELTTTVGLLRGPGNTVIPHTHTVTISENITVLSQVNQTTSQDSGHLHPIVDGKVGVVLGHSHSVVL